MSETEQPDPSKVINLAGPLDEALISYPIDFVIKTANMVEIQAHVNGLLARLITLLGSDA